jgi:hypothetical protein
VATLKLAEVGNLLDVEDVERELWHNTSPTSSHRQRHTNPMFPNSACPVCLAGDDISRLIAIKYRSSSSIEHALDTKLLSYPCLTLFNLP